MASSYSRKSNSSASNGKPTPRRAANSSSRSRTSSFGASSHPTGRPHQARPSQPMAGRPRPSARSGASRSAGSRPAGSRPSANRQLARTGTSRPSASRQLARSGPNRPVASNRPSSRPRPQASAQRTASLARRGNVSIRRTTPTSGSARPLRPASVPRAQRHVASQQRTPMAPVGRSVTTGSKTPSRLKMADRRSPGSLSRGGSKQENPVLGAIRSILSSIHLPQLSSTTRLVTSAAAAVVVVLFIVGSILFKSSLFAATDIVINGSEHISQETAQKLIDLPDDTTLLNVDSDAIVQSLKKSPWVKGVDVKREFPHKLIITPTERKVVAVAYISADNVAWAIGDDDTWIAPVSLAVGIDADGNVIDATGLAATSTDDQAGDSSAGDAADTGQDSSDASDGSDAADSSDSSSDSQTDSSDGSDDQGAVQTADGVTLLSGEDAARAVAQQLNAVLLTNMGTDVAPSSSTKVKGEGLAAALKYIAGFSPDFLSQIKSFSVPSVQALACNLKGGVEVSLGSADDIQKKERIVTKLLEEQTGVTYINVRTPDSYTYRSVNL